MYYNYHSHKIYTNIRVNDCIAKYEDYIARAKELGHKAVFSTEHGNSGNILKLYGLCQQNDLKCIHGYESYFVFDRHEKSSDVKNWHICIISLNKNGMHKNNLINSIANDDGFYYQPRVDMELLLQLPPEDVVVTTACVNNPIGFPREGYSVINDYLIPLRDHFGDHFFLEIQDHNDTVQIEVNKKIQEYSNLLGIPMIHGCDSHYIYPEDKDGRYNYLKGKGYKYDYEDNFILDYPDEKTIRERYRRQGVFSPKEVEQALKATLIFDEAEDLGFDKTIKMPTIYPELSLDERLALLKQHVNEKWKEYIKVHPPESNAKKREMIDGIRKEMKVIEDVNDEIRIADYFLLNEEIIRKGVENGGVITRTGRGSAPSYFINTLLGFSTINRFTAPIQLFPSRFISTARLLETRSMPDIDFNVTKDVPFVESSKEVLGDIRCYRMIAYGTQQEAAAFKNVCRAHDLDFKDSNDVSKNLDHYANDKIWGRYISEARSQIGVVDSISPSPCSFLLFDGDIREEFGLIRIKDELCVNLEKNEADEWKYLKNDILNVTVWGLISETFDLIDKPIPPYEELLQLCDDEVWNNFGDGITATINQCSTSNSKALVKTYKPRNMSELALFVAMIRPGAASLLQGFLKREDYSTGVAEIDELLASSSHYMAYQESIMAVLSFLGIHEDETYSIIKKISKKKFKEPELKALKQTLLDNFNIKVKDAGEEEFNRIWQVIEDAAAYSFNSSHALSVATDALYGMYLKTKYPLEYFTVCFNAYADDLDMTTDLTNELSHFGIALSAPKFRVSKGEYSFDKESRTIYKGLGSVKTLNKEDGNKLYSIRNEKIENLYDLFERLGDLKINRTKTEALININFFEEFGKNEKLLTCYSTYKTWQGRKTLKKDALPEWINIEWLKGNASETDKQYKDIDMKSLLVKYFDEIPDTAHNFQQQIELETELLGTPSLRIASLEPLYLVQKLNTTYTPLGTFYDLRSGEVTMAKVQKKKYQARPFKVGDILNISNFEEKPKWEKTEDGFEIVKGKFDNHVSSYTIKKGVVL